MERAGILELGTVSGFTERPGPVMRTTLRKATVATTVCLLLVQSALSQTLSEGEPGGTGEARVATSSGATQPRVTPEQWARLDRVTDRALAWLAAQQKPDGSFPTHETGQPGVTALCTLAFLSRGYAPDHDRYGPVVAKAVDYVLSCQHPDGLITRYYPMGPFASKNPTHTALYNHAIGSLLLSEVYGMTRGDTNRRLRKAIELAVEFTKRRLPAPKQRRDDEGGWRYARSKGPGHDDSDLSVTSWQLMFLRSARNAGFDVPSQLIDEALAYVRRCFDADEGTFLYGLRSDRKATRSMAGAGILSLSLGGQHHTREAAQAANWLLAHPFDMFHGTEGLGDRFFYGAFYCSQAMFQFGGTHWDRFYPPLLRLLATHQQADGSWEPELYGDQLFGNAYTTAMAVLAITPPYQMLPIFQR